MRQVLSWDTTKNESNSRETLDHTIGSPACIGRTFIDAPGSPKAAQVRERVAEVIEPADDVLDVMHSRIREQELRIHAR